MKTFILAAVLALTACEPGPSCHKVQQRLARYQPCVQMPNCVIDAYDAKMFQEALEKQHYCATQRRKQS